VTARRRAAPLQALVAAASRILACVACVACVGTLGACAARPKMCATPVDCPPAWGACVAGRCQPASGAVVQQAETRRLVVEPVDLAYVRRGDGARGGLVPTVFRLGAGPDGEAILLLRFQVTLPALARVAEAYVVLDRSDAIDVDPASGPSIALHAARIVERWDGDSVSWARLPRLDDARSPTTRVALGRARVRIDVREIVRRWRRHDAADQGIAVVADGASPTGVAFALAPTDVREGTTRLPAAASVRAASPPPFFAAPEPEGGASNLESVRGPPRLEIYVR
jgi:hypothetical protein